MIRDPVCAYITQAASRIVQQYSLISRGEHFRDPKTISKPIWNTLQLSLCSVVFWELLWPKLKIVS